MPQSTSLTMPSFAPLVALAFLGTGFLLFCALVGLAISLAFGKRRIARWIGSGGLVVAVGYGAALLLSSFASRERTLAPGGKKYFCEMDCHLAYSVSGAATVRAVGRPPLLVGTSGSFYVVTIRTWFDETTIASFRGNAPLTPNPRVAFLVDASGRRYAASSAGQRAWDEQHGPTAPLNRTLRPGESYETTLVFDLPQGASNPRLLVADPPGIENVLIGHENSPLHGKIYLALPPKAS